jgi:hypothetical protein
MDLARLYPKDFDDGEHMTLIQHLHLYIDYVRAYDRFSSLKNVYLLSQKSWVQRNLFAILCFTDY